MDFRVFFKTLGTILLAELGDKTQLATFCFAATTKSRISVFLGSAVALVIASSLAVLLGAVCAKSFPSSYVRYGAGALFIVLGVIMLLRG